MATLLKNPVVLALITAIATSTLGYLINQLPELPNKQQNATWIIGAVIGITLLVWIVAAAQNQKSTSSGAKTRVQGNRLKGKRNRLQVKGQNLEVSQNQIDGEDQTLSVEEDTDPPHASGNTTP